jgi:virulence-associated protein VagC
MKRREVKEKMVTKNTGTFKLSHKGKTGIIYVPADMVVDSAFPLKEGSVEIEIKGNELIIRPLQT